MSSPCTMLPPIGHSSCFTSRHPATGDGDESGSVCVGESRGACSSSATAARSVAGSRPAVVSIAAALWRRRVVRVLDTSPAAPGRAQPARYAAPRCLRRPAPASPPISAAARSSRRPTASPSPGACTSCAIADVAEELDVSTGLIHYHFATKDELIEAMLGEIAEREIAAVRARDRRPRDARGAAGAAIDVYLPSSRRDPSWVLWIDVWGEALRDANLRRISEELDNAWVELDRRGHRRRRRRPASFRCDDPVASAWRLCALLDGLGLQVVLHHGDDDPGPDAQARPPRRRPRARLRLPTADSPEPGSRQARPSRPRSDRSGGR